MAYVRRIEAPVLQEARLTGAVSGVARRTTEFLAACFQRELGPIVLGCRQRSLDQRALEAPFAEFERDAARSEAVAGARPGVGIGKTRVVLQAIGGEAVQGLGNGLPLDAARAELAFQFPAAVLAPRERADGEPAGVRPLVVVQASSSDSTSASSSTLPAAGVFASAWARMLPSISCATAGLSFRNWRTLSLPWPIRSPL